MCICKSRYRLFAGRRDTLVVSVAVIQATMDLMSAIITVWGVLLIVGLASVLWIVTFLARVHSTYCHIPGPKRTRYVCSLLCDTNQKIFPCAVSTRGKKIKVISMLIYSLLLSLQLFPW